MKTKQKLKLIFSNPINLLYLLKDHWLKYFLLILTFLLAMNHKSNAQVQNMVWAREGMGTGVDQGNAVTVDAAGNVYTTGYFESTCDFDPGAGIVNLNSVGNMDVFIMKSDASGNLLWAKSVGGTGDDEGKTIAVDASGNVYIGGSFSGTADLDPGAGT
ncbi:MAG: SBBP repeat-containing protein, partial [Bacteroidia bacterium]